MKHIKLFNLNESLTRKELVDELKNGAEYINVEYIDKDKNWGVCYTKNHQKFREGGFNTSIEVHDFLLDNGIDHVGMEAYLMIKKIRDKQTATIPFKKYQKEILSKGLKNLFYIE